MSTTASLLEFERDAVLAEALRDAARAPRYARVDQKEVAARLQALYANLLEAVEKRELTAIVEYAETLARARFRAGYDIADVQVAINALEEAVWRHLLSMCPPDELSEALRLVSTVLGAVKDTLARTWVELAKTGPLPDVSRLFAGTS